MLLEPFRLDEVSLGDSPFATNQQRTLDFLLTVDDDQQLYNFRVAAGLDTKQAPPMTGWDAPNGNLRGHTTGHYLSSLALAYGGTKDERILAKVEYMVEELGRCQDSMEASGEFGRGFLSAYSEEQFVKLEEYTPYPDIWAPYYTLHKIMAGLLDCYVWAHSQRALDICMKMGEWVYNRLQGLSYDQRSRMWSMYIAGEYGGINETLARLYGLSGQEQYIAAAKLFDNDKLLGPMVECRDTLDGMHANQHIPQMIGALRMYEETNESRYYAAARNFWDLVVADHCYHVGGTGEGEMFHGAGQIAAHISEKAAESCATYNMLKLTRDLFLHQPAAKYIDYYERALYNHMLATQDQSGPHGGSTYFMPLGPGMRKDYDTDGNSCCHGSGLESHIKYQEAVYFRTPDQSALYIGLYIPSTLRWEERGFGVVQEGMLDGGGEVTISIDGDGRLDIKLRVPYWADDNFTVRVNGEMQQLDAKPGTFVTLAREWRPGDQISILASPRLRLEETPDDPTVVGIMYGPWVVVALSESDQWMHVGEIEPTKDPLTFTMNGVPLVPNYAAGDCRYHAYFRRS